MSEFLMIISLCNLFSFLNIELQLLISGEQKSIDVQGNVLVSSRFKHHCDYVPVRTFRSYIDLRRNVNYTGGYADSQPYIQVCSR